MSDLTDAGGGRLTARFSFPPEFIGFQGHFPEMPVLPAVCKIQAAVAMLAASRKSRVRLDEIVLAKFSAPVTCDEEVEFSCTTEMEGTNSAVVKATVSKDGDRIARFKLRVTLEREEAGSP
jgi:3-hydroxyacyl-[acyl-carrier-protein] dehydratase